MRIVQFRLRAFRLLLRRPLRTAQGSLAAREGWWIALSDDEGHWGVGESTPLPGFAMESHAQCGEALRLWSAALPGRDVDEDALRDRGWAALAPPVGPFEVPAAAHGVELALLDIAAQRARQPLARWLHRAAATSVPVNATLGAESPAEAARQALTFAREGFSTLKVKVGADALDMDLARLRAVRDAVGSAVRLRVDANGAWSREDAPWALDAMAPLGLEYAEQPLAAGDLQGMAWLVARSSVPIAADESACSVRDAARVLAAGAAHVLVIKPMSLGGLVPTLDVVRRAAARGVPCVLTTTMDGAIARAGALHAAAAACPWLPRPPLAFGLATGSLLAQDLPGAPAPAGGALALPSLPGLGLPLAHERAFLADLEDADRPGSLDLPPI